MTDRSDPPSLLAEILLASTQFCFVAVALLAGVSLLLQQLATIEASIAPMLNGMGFWLMYDARGCLVVFLTLVTLHWNVTGMDSLRRRKHRRAPATTSLASRQGSGTFGKIPARRAESPGFAW